MSLHYLGLHRQFSSPTSKTFSVSETSLLQDQDLTQDSKDVLVERLNDLVLRLSNANSLEDHAITSIHSEVDKIELLIHGSERHQRGKNLSGETMAKDEKGQMESDGFWGPLSPSQNIRMRLPNSPPIPRNAPNNFFSRDPGITPAQVIKIAKAAEDLASKLSTAVTELELRKEESDHIHDLLITRLEKSTERILLLEYRIAEMEDDYQANQSELKFLRIQLQAIEAQCSQYIPRNDDPELNESIMNWKIDWEDIERRSKKRKNPCSITRNHISGTTRVVDTSWDPHHTE